MCVCPQGGRCVNSEGSFQCVCEAGYRGTAARGACVDVDECAELRVCRNGRCRNSPGSFRCDCLPGFTLSNDGRTCLGTPRRSPAPPPAPPHPHTHPTSMCFTDEVQDLCYEKYEDGQCSGPGTTPVTRSQCCCSATKGHLSTKQIFYPS